MALSFDPIAEFFALAAVIATVWLYFRATGRERSERVKIEFIRQYPDRINVRAEFDARMDAGPVIARVKVLRPKKTLVTRPACDLNQDEEVTKPERIGLRMNTVGGQGLGRFQKLTPASIQSEKPMPHGKVKVSIIDQSTGKVLSARVKNF